MGVVEDHKNLFEDVGSACIAHEDLHQHNILFENRRGNWQLAAVLDFDKAWAGHHEIDLARLEFWRGMTNSDFWEAYQATHQVDAQYRYRQPVYQLLWCLEFARNTAEHIRDTQRLFKEHGFPCPQSFD